MMNYLGVMSNCFRADMLFLEGKGFSLLFFLEVLREVRGVFTCEGGSHYSVMQRLRLGAAE